MRKKLFYFVAFLLIFLPVQIHAQDSSTLVIDQREISLSTPAEVQEEDVLIPVEDIAEALEVDYEWLPVTQKLLIYDRCDRYAFTMGEHRFRENYSTFPTSVAPVRKDGMVFLPGKALGKLFHRQVKLESGRVVFRDLPDQVPQNTFEMAEVVRVVDGDTIIVDRGHGEERLRMILVDTPETVHPNKPVEYYGKEASDYTKKMLTGHTVYLQRDVSDTDRYGRLLRYVWLARPATDEPGPDEIGEYCFNAILLEFGYAQLSTFPPDLKYVDDFERRAETARREGRGLYGSSGQAVDGPSSQEKTGPSSTKVEGKIKGNKNSKIYHLPGGASYDKVSDKNAVYFKTEQEAKDAGYRRAKN